MSIVIQFVFSCIKKMYLTSFLNTQQKQFETVKNNEVI